MLFENLPYYPLCHTSGHAYYAGIYTDIINAGLLVGGLWPGM